MFPVTSLRQPPLGGRIVFSLLLDPLSPEQVAPGARGKRALHFLSVNASGGMAAAVGEVPLGDEDASVWRAGGGKVAVLRKRADSGGSTELAVYAC